MKKFVIKNPKELDDLYSEDSPRLAVTTDEMSYDEWVAAGFQFAENMWEMSDTVNDMLKKYKLELIEIYDPESTEIGFKIQKIGKVSKS